jgi:hypothetical protein
MVAHERDGHQSSDRRGGRTPSSPNTAPPRVVASSSAAYRYLPSREQLLIRLTIATPLHGACRRALSRRNRPAAP